MSTNWQFKELFAELWEKIDMSKILIKNGRVWDGEKFCFADVLTENEKIIKIADKINETAEFEYDASGKIVSPGLVDAHVHMRGINKDFGIHAELSCIPFGVTAAADACGAFGDKALLDTFLLKNVIFVPVDFRSNKACFDSTEKMLEKYGEKAIGLKVYFDTHISDVQDIRSLCEVVKFAEKKNLIIMVHSTNSPSPMKEIINCLRSGDILTHAYHGGINTTQDDGFDCIFEAKKRGVIVDAGFAGHIHTDFNVFKSAVRVGALPDIISTDITRYSAYKRGGRYGMTMCMSIAKTAGMNEEDIFRSVTSSAAKALKMETKWGYLKMGRCADISVFEYGDEGFSLCDNQGNTLESQKGYRCILTVSDGEIVYKD